MATPAAGLTSARGMHPVAECRVDLPRQVILQGVADELVARQPRLQADIGGQPLQQQGLFLIGQLIVHQGGELFVQSVFHGDEPVCLVK